VDGDALRTALAFVRVFQPSHVFLIGDVLDAYQVSTFDKDPERRFQLQDDIDAAYGVLKQIRKAAPQAIIYYLKGNHEHRMQKYLWRQAPELSGLRSLSLPKLLSLDDLKIKWVEEGSMMFHGFLVKHGNIVRSRSGYTATGEMEKAGVSGVSGHTHRLSQIFKRNYGGMFTWVECGCLCQLQPEYADGALMDWGHGLAVGHFAKESKRFNINPYPIIKGTLLYDGREITG
jgi:hypothetical protein